MISKYYSRYCHKRTPSTKQRRQKRLSKESKAAPSPFSRDIPSLNPELEKSTVFCSFFNLSSLYLSCSRQERQTPLVKKNRKTRKTSLDLDKPQAQDDSNYTRMSEASTLRNWQTASCTSSRMPYSCPINLPIQLKPGIKKFI